jgi:eukaryotic-like serine/threonine-protein kinase
MTVAESRKFILCPPKSLTGLHPGRCKGPMQVKLRVSAGPHKGRSFEFREHDTFIVGRASYAHFRLEAQDKFFSRAHFLIEVNPPLCRLIDMGSTNGTYVNGKKVDEIDLKNGDRIRGGKTAIRVTIESSDSAEETEAQAAQGASVGSEPTMTRSFEMVAPAPEVPGGSASLGGPQGRIAHYQIVRELGRGGMGVVHLATRNSDRLAVAIKTIQPRVAVSPRDVERFLREAAILRALDHPGIVRFLELGEHDGLVYLAMEYVDGDNLAAILKRTGPFTIGRASKLICDLLEALRYAHGRNFVHRDIKPGNLILVGESGGLKLADFGLARAYQESKMSGLTLHGDVGGTIAFCAPEQITNFRQAKPAADLYSVGVTLYMMLTGRHVYDFPNSLNRQVLMILQENPVPLKSRRSDIPQGLANIVHRALARNPGDRFSDAQSMRQALLPFSE